MRGKLNHRHNNIIYEDETRGFSVSYRQLNSRLKIKRDNESWHNLYRVKVTVIGRRVSRSYVSEKLALAFSGSRCRYTLECCGCSFWKTYKNEVVHSRRNEYLILQHEYYNWLTSTDLVLEDFDNGEGFMIRRIF